MNEKIQQEKERLREVMDAVKFSRKWIVRMKHLLACQLAEREKIMSRIAQLEESEKGKR